MQQAGCCSGTVFQLWLRLVRLGLRLVLVGLLVFTYSCKYCSAG